LGVGSDEEGDDAEEAEEEEDVDNEHALSEAAGSDAGGAIQPVDEGDDPSTSARCRVLSRIAAGEQADLPALKQKIQDDIMLLGSWRKARELGDKRQRDEVFATLVSNCSLYFGYAEELAEYFLRMFSPEQALKFFEANEQQRPLTIRTNSLKARRSSLIQSLTARKVQLDVVGDWTKVGLKIFESEVPIGATPEYLGGQYMVQSASSFIPVMALAPQQNETVLDMAAAPGGKTTYIGQLMRNTGTLFANDLKADRCKSLVSNCHRMGLTNVIVTNLDGLKLKGVLPKLDRVLLDAPCTGSGIIARDPSVKVKRGQKDFQQQSKLQKEMLMSAIDMVDAGSKTGGYIVYSTCSISVEENEAVIDAALTQRNVEVVSFTSSVNFGMEGLAKFRERRFHPSISHCRRYYPHTHNMDGFFVAKLRKTSNEIPQRIKQDRSKMADHIKSWGEEHWSKEMMDTVMDFPEPGQVPELKKAMNKIERKKIKRQMVLQERAKAAAAAAAQAATEGGASAEAAAAPAAATEPEEEPKPQKTLGKKKRKSSEGEASNATPASMEAEAEASTTAVPPEGAAPSNSSKSKRRKKV